MAHIMSKCGSEDNVRTYEFFCDYPEDLNNIPMNRRTLGSVALVLDYNEECAVLYVCKSDGNWVGLKKIPYLVANPEPA